jgi:hypothetical protein
MQLGVLDVASYSLDLTITTAGEQPEYQAIKQRAELMKEAIDKQIEAAAPAAATAPVEEEESAQ